MLLVVAVDRLLALRFEAERTTVHTVIGALRSALYIDFAAAAARGEIKRMDKARGSNPMAHLAEKPDAYVGEFYGAGPEVFEPGTWYFDLRDRRAGLRGALSAAVRHLAGRAAAPAAGGAARLRRSRPQRPLRPGPRPGARP